MELIKVKCPNHWCKQCHNGFCGLRWVYDGGACNRPRVPLRIMAKQNWNDRGSKMDNKKGW